MAVLDFPNTPTTGQLFSAPNGAVYRWDGAAWVVEALPNVGPSGPAGGDLDGTYPNPILRDQSVTNFKIVSVSWDKITSAPDEFFPMGPAGGDLKNFYPNPDLREDSVHLATLDATLRQQVPPPLVLPDDQGKVLTCEPGTGLAKWLVPTGSAWTFNGPTGLTPLDPARTIQCAPVSPGLEWTVHVNTRARLVADISSAGWSVNANPNGVVDDPAHAQWRMDFWPTADKWEVRRSPAGTLTAFVPSLSLDGLGVLAVRSPVPTVLAGKSTLSLEGYSNVSGGESQIRFRRAGLSEAPLPSGIPLAGVVIEAAYTPGVYRPAAQLRWITTSNYSGTTGGSQFEVWCQSDLSPGQTHFLFFRGPDGSLEISGSQAFKPTGGSWANPSDPRLKRDVAPYTAGLEAICALDPIMYKFNGLGGIVNDDRQCYGLDARQVEAVLPECVFRRSARLTQDDRGDTDILMVDPSNLTLILINAVKALAARMDTYDAHQGAPT